MSRDLSYNFGYFVESRFSYLPKTQSAALMAFDAGLVPEESYLSMAVNIRPIFEEPYNIMEIERLLARKNLNVGSAILLMRIFEQLIINPDKELALFAAESINSLEMRYNDRIQALKRSYREKVSDVQDPSFKAVVRKLVKNLYELGLLNISRPVLKYFYLGEAYAVYQENWHRLDLHNDDMQLLIKLLLESSKIHLAEKVLDRSLRKHKQDPFLLFLMAQVQFAKRDYIKVMSILVFLNDGNKFPKVKKVYQFWIGENT